MIKPLKTIPLDTMIDKHIGMRGTERRQAFERELNSELLNLTRKTESEKKIKKIVNLNN